MAGTPMPPMFQAVGNFSGAATGTSVAPPMPTLAATVGAYLAVVSTKNNDVHSTATPGWTKLQQVNSGASYTASLWIAQQGAAAPTFTWTNTVANSAQIGYYVDPNGTVGATVSVSGTTGSGTTTTHTSTGFNSDANNVLAVYIDACSANTNMATPAGWTEDADVGSATNACHHTWGSKAIATSGSASGNISVVGGGTAWVQFQVELKNVPATAGQLTTKEALAAWVEPAGGVSSPKVDLLGWMDADDARFSKLDALVWMDVATVSRRRTLFLP